MVAALAAGVLLSAALALTGCGGKAGDSAEPAGGWDDLLVETDPFALAWGTGALPAGAVEVGFVEDYDSTLNYDPWNLWSGSGAPDIDWEPAVRGTWSAGGYDLELADGRTARLDRLDDGEGGPVRLRLTVDEAPAPYLRLSFASPAGEALWGLGENFDAVNLRGTVRPMQIEVNAEVESGYVEAHVPVPVVVGSGGWGAAVPSDWPMVVDAASPGADGADPERVSFVVATEDPLDIVLLGGAPGEAADGADLVAAWTRLAGLPRLPPTWAMAPMLWRDENDSDAQVLEDARAVRDHDLAFGVMWVDNPWQTTYNSMRPDDRFADWDGMVAELHDLGFRWMAWSTPYLEDADPDHDAFADAGWFVDIPVLFSDFGDLVDLTHPDAMAAWQERVAAAAAIGIEGWKLDYGEDVNLGLGTGRLVTTFADGSDERTMHHRFAAHYHRAYAEPYDEAGADRFLLGRGGAWGTEAITDCIWPGDLCNGFEKAGEDGHVGGLPAAIRAGVSLSVSGFPCFASDTGGYRHGRADRETIIRWTEYSALLPIMQVGGTENHHYWLLEGDWDEDVLAAGQRYTVLHTRLFPYFRRLLVDAAAEGRPPLRPLGMAAGPDPDPALLADDAAFLVGEDLLVAPVEEAGATSRTVTFPPGEWVHWWTGEAWSGEAEVPAPLGEGPLFIRAGGIVPMLRESVRTLAPSDGAVDSWADDPGELVVRHVPAEGGGRSFEVVDGPLIVAEDGALAVGDPGIYDGVTVEIWAPGASTVEVDGEAVDTEVDGPWLRARVGSGTVTWR